MSAGRVTLTGATGPDRRAPRGRAAQPSGWEVTVLPATRARAASGSATDVRGGALGPARANRPRRGAERPRRGRAPRRRDRSPSAGARAPSARSARAACSARENLLAGLRAATRRARRAPVSASAVGYYGAARRRADRRGGAARAMTSWPRSARPGRRRPRRARELGMRVVLVRTGVVLDGDGGALEKMLPPFRLGVGRPGRGRAPVHALDPRRGCRRASTAPRSRTSAGAARSTRPRRRRSRTATSRARSGARCTVPRCCPSRASRCGRSTGRWREIVTERRARGARRRPLMLGYAFRHPELDEALSSALARAERRTRRERRSARLLRRPAARGERGLSVSMITRQGRGCSR